MGTFEELGDFIFETSAFLHNEFSGEITKIENLSTGIELLKKRFSISFSFAWAIMRTIQRIEEGWEKAPAIANLFYEQEWVNFSVGTGVSIHFDYEGKEYFSGSKEKYDELLQRLINGL